MNKKNFTLLSIILMILGLVGVARLSENNTGFRPANAEATLQKTIDFEDITYGNMSATAHNSYYGGVIVADGKVTRTGSALIDTNTLGMRMPASTLTEPRVAVIKVSGYTKIVLDLKQERTYTRISTGCSLLFIGSKNAEIIRGIEIPTYGYHEITLTFFTETSIASTMDCGIDNIRFYAPGPVDSSESSSSIVVSSSSEIPSSTEISSSSETEEIREEIPAVINGVITMRGIADFLETKETHYPLSNLFIEDYQQTSGGYIALAKSLGLLVDKSSHEPNQKWHFFDSWMYPSIAEGTLKWSSSAKDRVYTKLLCPELLLWIYEASEVPTSKIEAAMAVAVDAKINGTHISTMAKNMRACVPWEDIEVTILNFIASQS